MALILNNTKTPTLCLNMIVKNESSIITRLFDSVISIIDCYCICDTGSSDNTIELIETYFKEKNISGKIIQEPFQNFSYNRNFALQSCISMSDYVLLLDADMILQLPNFNKNRLQQNHYSILQGNDTFYYKNIRIIQNNGLYSYYGVTHEYINTPKDSIGCLFKKDELFIHDIGDGGSKQDKFERDIKLLTDEPENDRNIFYLANTYFDYGKKQEAIQLYKKRIELGGWKQEVWYSYYKLGQCYQELGQCSDAIYNWLEGYNYLPERLEGIYEIIKYYRYNGKNTLAFQFYKIAKQLLDNPEINRDNYLFLHNHVYTHSIYYEYIIIAYYNGITNVNNEIITYMNHSDNPSLILSNIKFYKQVLKPYKVINFTDTYFIDDAFQSFITFQSSHTFQSSSSCLIYSNNTNKYLINIRYVNYTINPNGIYKYNNQIISLNKTMELDNEFVPVSESWKCPYNDGRTYVGVEDIRIYNDIYDNKVLYIGTGYHQNNTLGIVYGEYENIHIHINKNKNIHELSQTFRTTTCEKNWVFVDYNKDTHIIYDWHPVSICKLNKTTNMIHVVDTKPTPKLFSQIRGSTCGFLTTQKEIWFINHIVSHEMPRHYYHIISVFDIHMNLLRYTAPFKFEGEPIEYCLSILVEETRVLINYSVWDKTTKIGIYDKLYIDSLLVYSS